MSNAKQIFTMEIIPQRTRTTDTILRTPTRAELAVNQKRTGELANLKLGSTVWAGDLKAQLASMTAADRATVLDAIRRVMEDFAQNTGSDMREGAFGNMSTARPEKEFSLDTSAQPSDINSASAEKWEGPQAASDRRKLTRDVAARAAGIAPGDLNAINVRFWAGRAAPRIKPWGKG
jgi:hypothetical protein